VSIRKDNSTLRLKAQLRIKALAELGSEAIVLEAYGGLGKLFPYCYSGIEQGIVFEKLAAKTDILAKQRPTWSVYEGDCIRALRGGAGAHLTVNFADFDPYGECWPALTAFFQSERTWPDRLVLAVNDGLRRELMMKSGWHANSMRPWVERYGNDHCFKRYDDICKLSVIGLARLRNYTVTRWTCYYCGHGDNMTHFGAVLDRESAGKPH
jgi:hypothetical protein